MNGGTVPPRAVVATIALSVIGCALFLVLPQFVEAAITDLHYSEREVGFLGSLLMGGQALSAIASTFWVHRMPWRRALVLAALGQVATCAACLGVHTPVAFMALQCVGGFFAGSLYSLSLTMLSDSEHADRHFGYAVAAQVVFQVAGLLLGPELVRLGGVNAFMMLLIVLGALALLLAPLLPVAPRNSGTFTTGGSPWTVPTVLALAGCFLFFVNVGCYWNYIELIGTGAGLSAQAVANGLAVGVAFGVVGALAASWLGDRRGRLLPIAVAAALTVLAALLLLRPIGLATFIGSAVCYNLAWNLSLAFQYSTVNAVDRTGRGVAAAPAFHGAGGSAGPALAALLIGPGDLRWVIGLVAASVLLSVVCFAVAMRAARVTPTVEC